MLLGQRGDAGRGLPGLQRPVTHLLAQQVRQAGVTPRTHLEVTALFGGLPLVPPGVVPVTEWRPGTGPAARADLYAGMARLA